MSSIVMRPELDLNPVFGHASFIAASIRLLMFVMATG